MKTKHLVMSIEGLERKLSEYKSYWWKNKYCKDCFNMTIWKVKKEIQKYKDKWYEVIPWWNCKNIGEKWRCEC